MVAVNKDHCDGFYAGLAARLTLRNIHINDNVYIADTGVRCPARYMQRAHPRLLLCGRENGGDFFWGEDRQAQVRERSWLCEGVVAVVGGT